MKNTTIKELSEMIMCGYDVNSILKEEFTYKPGKSINDIREAIGKSNRDGHYEFGPSANVLNDHLKNILEENK